jgi:hypothetical protein
LKHAVERASKLYLEREVEGGAGGRRGGAGDRPEGTRAALLLKANVLIERKEFAAAREAAEAASASDPALADAQLALGVIEQERGGDRRGDRCV